MDVYARLGIETVAVTPTGDPLVFTRRVGDELTDALAELQPA
jgi:hypothetical protein